MYNLTLIFVVSCVIALLGLSHVEAGLKVKRETETTQEPKELGGVQQQLTTAFDSLKKSMDEFTSKFNVEGIVQGVQGLTSKFECQLRRAVESLFVPTIPRQSRRKEKSKQDTKQLEQPQPEQPQP